jgi:tetratricopeptide (TPR) repeat protein
LSERNLQSAHSDLEMVRKLAGDVPSVLVAEGDYALYVEWDADKALRLVETPQVVASTDSYVMTRRAVILGFARRLDESFALFARAAELDPGNMNVLGPRLAFLWTARRPAQALQARRAYQRQLPRTLPWGELVFAYTGKLDEWNDDVNHDDDSIDIGARLSRRVQWLRFQNRIAEAIDAIERADLKMIRSGGVGGVRTTGVGRRPVAELHGWAKLLARDAVGAARDGQIMLDFAEHEPVTKWNSWYLRFIAAEGALFSGNKTQAIADARAVLTMTPGDRIPFMRLYANATAAQIFAWAGAEDEAVALLEELSKGFPGLGPAAITRDPLYSIPLKNNARYKVLEKKLEAEIVENRKLL